MKFTYRFLMLLSLGLMALKSQATNIPSLSDSTLAYSMPLLYKT